MAENAAVRSSCAHTLGKIPSALLTCSDCALNAHYFPISSNHRACFYLPRTQYTENNFTDNTAGKLVLVREKSKLNFKNKVFHICVCWVRSRPDKPGRQQTRMNNILYNKYILTRDVIPTPSVCFRHAIISYVWHHFNQSVLINRAINEVSIILKNIEFC